MAGTRSYIVLILLAAAYFRCDQVNPAGPELVERWFTGTADEPPRELVAAPGETFDAIVKQVRSGSMEGKGTCTLKDTCGREYAVGFRTPSKMRGDSLYPCIVYLHGGTGSRLPDKGERAYEMLDMLYDSMDLFLVSPSSDRQAPWWSPAGLSRILQTLRFMTIHYPVDPEKVFLAGVSDGATGCWAAANTIPGPFAGFFAVSGFGGMLPRLGMKLHVENLMQRPLYNVNAGKDRLYPPAAVERFLDFLERSGVEVLRKTYADEEHGFDYRLQELGTLCSLVNAWSLPEAEGINWRGSNGYPMSVDHVLECNFSGSGGDTFSIRGFCREDTFFLRTDGIIGLQMYFDKESCVPEAIFSINGHRGHRQSPSRNNRKRELLLMKRRCFPVTGSELLFTIPL